LTTDQALADEVYFAKNVVFEGLEHLNLTAPNVAYIGYGGSYAGAFNAFLRKLYPDVFWGICFLAEPKRNANQGQAQFLRVVLLKRYGTTGRILSLFAFMQIKNASYTPNKSHT
jgi:hypothetical protein